MALSLTGSFKEVAETLLPAMEVAVSFKQNKLLMGLSSGNDENYYNIANAAKYSDISKKSEKEDKARRDNQRFIDLLDQLSRELRDMEAGIAKDYGDNFAGNLLSDLHANGKIDEDEYNRIMAIKDDDERRRAIAEFIRKGLESGTLTMDDLDGHPWVPAWLDKHAHKANTIEAQARESLENGDDLSEQPEKLAAKAVDIADNQGQSIADINKDVEKAQTNKEIDKAYTSPTGGFG